MINADKGTNNVPTNQVFNEKFVKDFSHLEQLIHQAATDGTPTALKAIKVDLSGEPSNLPEALLVDNKGLFNKGEIATIVAQPGTGKSNVCEAIIAAYARAKGFTPFDTLNFVYSIQSASKGKKALWFDTERTHNDTLKSVRRLRNRCGTTPDELDTCLHFYRCRTLTPKEQLTDLKTLVATSEYDLVIIDGIFGLCPNINDMERAGEIMKELEILAETYDVAILVTIHPNKNSDTISGNLGSILYKFCRAVLYIEKLKNEVRRLTTEIGQHKLSHSSGEVNVPFSWSEEHNMFTVCDMPDVTPTGYDVAIVQSIFGEATQMKSKDFKAKYAQRVGLSTRRVDTLCTDMYDDKIIDRVGNGGATIYTLLEREILPF